MSHDSHTDAPPDDSSAQSGPAEQESWEARVLSRITNRINELAPELDHFGWESQSLLLLRQRLAFRGE